MASSNGRLLAFESAQGFGAQTTGGRGGDIIKVTNLNDSGKGSLRWALEEMDGPRIVVFDVGGHIKLRDEIVINGDVTIAGQTAPGGITVSGGRLRIVEDNVIVRGMEIRPGNSKTGQDSDHRDGISIGSSKNKVENVVIDSNSISWSIDEGISVWGDVEGVTISNNIVANALRDSIHSKGEHSMAMLIGDGASEISIVGNLLAHNKYRNPLVKEDSHKIEFVNNLVYNYGDAGFIISGDSSAHVINNVYMKGADSSGREPIRFLNSNNGSEYYVSGNIGEVSGGSKSIKNGYVFKPQVTDVLKTKDVEKYVLANAGANADDRGPLDQRVINDVKNGTGKIIDNPNQVGGTSQFTKAQKPLTDSDNDGIPNAYERLIGSNERVSDANKDADRDGISNIEEYINGLIDGFSKDGTVRQTDNGPSQSAALAAAEEAAREKAAAEKAAAQKAAAEKAAEEKAAAREAAAKKAASEKSSDGSVVVEAEDMDIDQGFKVKKIGSASDQKLLQAGDKGLQKASLIFEGASGTYALSIDYFDESDGESELAVIVNDQQVASWTWDQKLGTNIANHNSLTSKVIKGLELETGDQIQLAGRSDGREPLRVDKLTFEVDTSGTTSSQKNGPAKTGEVIRVQAEDFELEGFREARLNAADEKKVIAAITKGPHKAEHEFEGDTGVYDILVDYFDEADGESELTLAVNGKSIDTWVWDDSTTSNNARADNLTTHVIEGVTLKKGDDIMLIGVDDGREPLRIDAVEFAQVDFV